jgi:hypothetical protein
MQAVGRQRKDAVQGKAGEKNKSICLSPNFLSEQTSHQQPASSTFLSEQTSTSHQPPAKRTGFSQFRMFKLILLNLSPGRVHLSLS